MSRQTFGGDDDEEEEEIEQQKPRLDKFHLSPDKKENRSQWSPESSDHPEGQEPKRPSPISQFFSEISPPRSEDRENHHQNRLEYHPDHPPLEMT